jgi:hypothetical protein
MHGRKNTLRRERKRLSGDLACESTRVPTVASTHIKGHPAFGRTANVVSTPR